MDEDDGHQCEYSPVPISASLKIPSRCDKEEGSCLESATKVLMSVKMRITTSIGNVSSLLLRVDQLVCFLQCLALFHLRRLEFELLR